MLEGEHARCSACVSEHGTALLETLAGGGTVVVNCQEGLHRSVDFARRLREKAGAPVDSVLGARDGAIIEEGDEDEDLDDQWPTRPWTRSPRTSYSANRLLIIIDRNAANGDALSLSN